jgi:hypothetical protein
MPQGTIGALNARACRRGRFCLWLILACSWSAASPTARRRHDPDAAAAPDGPGRRQPVHFGIIKAVGIYTPPFGLNLFASQAIFNQRLSSIYRGVLPSVVINFATPMVTRPMVISTCRRLHWRW